MAKQTNVNLAPADGAEAIYELQVFLRDSLGFTITRSGDGLAAFDDTGTSVITAPGSGANGMNNTDAHFTAQDPNGEYEWCFQRNAAADNWEVIYSALDGFTGGSATVRPTATDEQVLHDGILFPANFGRWHLMGFDVGVGSPVAVFPWFAVGMDAGSDPEVFIAHEALTPGSYPALTGTRANPTTGDADPSIQICQYDNGSTEPFEWVPNDGGWADDNLPTARAWYAMNDPEQEQYVPIQGSAYHGSDGFGDVVAPGDVGGNDGLGVNPYNGNDEILPIPVGRSSGTVDGRPFFKGFCDNLYWKAIGGRAYPDTCDVSGERFLYTVDVVLPFENGTTPL